MNLNYYVVDAFADGPFTGNPAGVCVLENPLTEVQMQQIAAQNNLAETAFVIPLCGGVAHSDGVVLQENDYDLRWFTPVTEINLCGHATLATAFVLHKFFAPNMGEFRFHSKSGLLTVTPKGDLYELDFPAWPAEQMEITPLMQQAIGCEVSQAYASRDLFLIVKDQATVQTIKPDFVALAALHSHAVAVTAPGESADFVSRFFAPNVGIAEDHVTGSLHSQLIPFWAQQLGKNTLVAKQLSQRGGTLYCDYLGERVKIAGRAKLYLTGELYV